MPHTAAKLQMNAIMTAEHDVRAFRSPRRLLRSMRSMRLLLLLSRVKAGAAVHT
jgi:hypothetical protein